MAKVYMECPCCGDDGAESDEDGFFFDGQGLICGCHGWVSADEDETWINTDGCACDSGEDR